MPIWLFTHVLHFLMQLKLGELSPSHFCLLCVFLHVGGSFLHFPDGWEDLLVMLSAGLFHSRFIVVFLIVHAQEIRFCVVE